MDNYIEKEIKLEIDNPGKLLARLSELKAKKISCGFQRTIRMDTPDMDLEKKGTFLRVRSGTKNIVTMKKKIKGDGEVFERQELETEVNDSELLADIFGQLGFSKQLIMEKYRIDYTYNKVKISVDELPFGMFIELEGEPESIMTVAGELGLDITKKIIVTYWDLFADYKKKTGEQGENIVFPENHQPVVTALH